MKKQIFAMLIALVMLVGMVPVSALAADGPCENCDNAPYVPDAVMGKHLRKCDTCGYTYSSGKCVPDQHGFCETCKGLVTHTCNSDVLKNKDKNFHEHVCSLCGVTQSKEKHKFTYVSLDTKQHAKLCVCGHQINIGDHNDTDSDGKCNYCKYEMEKHVCTYDAGVTSNGDGTHNTKCACGQFAQIKCSDADGDGKCDSCDYQQYAHVCDFMAGTTSNDNGSHNINCSCGRFIVFACVDTDGDNKCDSCEDGLYTPPTEDHDHKYVTHSNNDGTHTTSCTCGGSVTMKCLDNSGDNKCDSCDYNMYTPPAGEHSHVYIPHSNNDGTHTSSCSCGLEVENIKCADYDGDNECDACKYVLYTPTDKEHEHNYVTHTNNNGTHTTSCTCGGSVTVHCTDNDGDNNCDSCGYNMYTPPSGAHSHNFVPHSNNDGTHTSSCTCGLEVENIKCGDYDGDNKCDACKYVLYTPSEEEHEHNYVTHTNNDGTHTTSCTCGNSVTLTCLDSDGDGKCDSCDYQKYVHNCVGRSWTSNNNGTHSSKCSCGLVMDGPYDCQTINGETCYMCGYNMHKCNFEAGVTSNEDGTHNINCACGEFIQFTCMDSNGDNKCDSCGYQKYVHNCVGRAWTANNDGTHTSKCSCGLVMDGPYDCQTINGRTCYMCGYDMHKCFVETEIVANKDGLAHSIFCATCGEFWKSEAHNWKNGVCTECGAKKSSSGTVINCKHPSGVSVGQEIFEATCEEDGYILTTKVCNECGKTYVLNSPLGKATGHNWYQTITQPTCTKPGNEYYECTNCGDCYDVAISATGHSYVNGKCACGTVDPELDVTPSTPSNKRFYTWDFQDIFIVG